MFTISRTRLPLADLQVAFADRWTPAVDVVENKDRIELAAELPGVRPEAVTILLENNLLTIRGEKQQPSPDQSADSAHRIERGYGAFERSFTVPDTVDVERIEARYEHGVLTISLPKAERARPRQITVQVNG